MESPGRTRKGHFRFLMGGSSHLSVLKPILAIREVRVLLTLLLIVVFFAFFTGGKYLSVINLVSVLNGVYAFGIVAGAMTLLLISGEIDLSVGSVYALSPVIAAILVKRVPGFTIWSAVPLAIGIAAFCGFTNGIITTKGRIPSFITTLGMMMILRGVAFVLSKGQIFGFLPPSVLYTIFGGTVFKWIPVGVIWFPAIIVCLWILLEKTAFGNRTFATGNNKEAARMAGINTDRVKIINFTITGALAGFAGITVLSYLGQAAPQQGIELAFDAIAAAVVGGTSLFGGAGGVIGTLVGVFIVGGVKNGIIIRGAPIFWPEAFVGVIIVLAVIFNVWIERKMA